MVRINIPGIFSTYKRLKDGTRRTYWYDRGTGARLRGEPGSSEFMADLSESRKIATERQAGTFANLIRDFTPRNST